MTLPRVTLTDPKALRGYAHPLRMSLIALLRAQGPTTATRAAEQLGESVASCSFHLRQLAKYGLAERAPGADGRERPWRATALATYWDDDSDDPQVRAATDELNAAQLALYTRRAQEFLARRPEEPAAWRAVTAFSDWPLHVTPEELAELDERIDAVLSTYDDRITDPSRRPAGSRRVSFVRLAVLPPPAAPEAGEGESDPKRAADRDER
ncbi:winged helix-turn-helix domain-containing protein [Micromonospora costi]|uniref:ArsR family transcriptional regulator n=1 Tax=Micromonospora costi TaxID=1530042 RepID=A0A3B0ADS5_9ACTN|nr:helix-turn-helix domain-containing protein [Micromonospora costi]RKN58705.1 ArsR family transcriptional regulator [Micromonospora costi]